MPQAQPKLRKYLDERLFIQLNGSRKVIGVLRCYDVCSPPPPPSCYPGSSVLLAPFLRDTPSAGFLQRCGNRNTDLRLSPIGLLNILPDEVVEEKAGGEKVKIGMATFVRDTQASSSRSTAPRKRALPTLSSDTFSPDDGYIPPTIAGASKFSQSVGPGARAPSPIFKVLFHLMESKLAHFLLSQGRLTPAMAIQQSLGSTPAERRASATPTPNQRHISR
ncbi:hypothetical protein H2199_008823 [Coniosporium tulheliwenetii]|uniref:Uncharacterized protein n=1 Tax=Coniosporium tulheliwenetii TaxID=3383036 RepID=A0ACC2YHP7_9PEZI|nr:hypothetical protein H2199_008823 [Cladosporium sp. JES 115]